MFSLSATGYFTVTMVLTSKLASIGKRSADFLVSGTTSIPLEFLHPLHLYIFTLSEYAQGFHLSKSN